MTYPLVSDRSLVTGYFNGVEQKGECGARVVIKLNMNHCFRLRMAVGLGTNTKTDLVALWGLLWFALQKKLRIYQILGDSKVIIDWVN